MFTHKDIELRTIFVINCIEKRHLRVSSGELLLEEETDNSKKTLTKLPFQKILALFVIGNMTVTTPLIEKCKQYNVALVVMKPNLRPVFFVASTAEANYLVRHKQYQLKQDDISISKILVSGKINNQLSLLNKTRKADECTVNAQNVCNNALNSIHDIADYNYLMGIEGIVSKHFFAAYFQQFGWTARKPRVKNDTLNVTLDIGYTLLFNYIESFVRMFGFDVYAGVYHRLWFRRKSLICDLMEPFRCIIDHTIRIAFNRKQFQASDFIVVNNEYKLKYDRSSHYYQIFFEDLIKYKMDIFRYIQSYYRCFMQGKSPDLYPKFII